MKVQVQSYPAVVSTQLHGVVGQQGICIQFVGPECAWTSLLQEVNTECKSWVGLLGGTGALPSVFAGLGKQLFTLKRIISVGR